MGSGISFAPLRPREWPVDCFRGFGFAVTTNGSLSRHVTLFDLERYPPEPVAGGQGADEAEALLGLVDDCDRALPLRQPSPNARCAPGSGWQDRVSRASSKVVHFNNLQQTVIAV